MIAYDSASVPVRQDLIDAHRRSWSRIGQPGTWWTGEERVAIAREVRQAAACEICRWRKESLSPYSATQEHYGNGILPAAAVEAVHRVTTDPGRLKRAWFQELMRSGLTDGQYVEAIGVLVTVFSIDSFCRGIGVPPHPLPAPEPGEPLRYRPAAARMEKAWVPMLPNKRLAGAEGDLWGNAPAGRTGNVIRALSLVPNEVRGLNELSAVHYLSPLEMLNLKDSKRAIDRMQIELIAGRVSAARGCFY